LRAGAMLLGLVLHSALSFIPGIWPVQDSSPAPAFGLLVTAIHGFRMPLFFLLSGFFTAMLWRRRGLRSLIVHRFRRIVLPLVLCLFTIVPLVNVVTKWAMSAEGAETAGAEIKAEVKDIWTAARLGDVPAIQRLAEAGQKLDARDPIFGTTPLVTAAIFGQEPATEALLAAGADPNGRTKDGGTPLHAAAFLGHPDIVTMLLDAGADAGLKNDRGETPMDSLKVPWETTQFIAKLLKLEVESERVMNGREECAALFSGQGFAVTSGLADGGNQRLQRLFARPFFHHLWFLWFLCWLVVGFSGYALVMRRLGWRSLPPWLVVSPLRFLWLLPLTMIPQWFMGRAMPNFGPDTSLGILPLPQVLIYYAIFFGFGALYYDCDDRAGRLGKWWWLALPVSLLVIYPAGMGVVFGDAQLAQTIPSPVARRVISTFLQVTYAWLMSCGLIGFCRVVLARERRWIRYLSDSAYWLYIAHIPLVIGLQAVLRDWKAPAIGKFAVICLIVTLVLLVSYETVVRYTWLGRLLNGRREREKTEAV